MNYKHTRLYVLTLTITALSGTIATSIAPACAETTTLPTKIAAVGGNNLNPVKQAEVQLKEMGESIHRTKCADSDLVRECSRVNEVMGGEIDFVGGEIIPIFPDTSEGMGTAQTLPPRPKYINLHMSQLTQLLPILQDDVQSTRSPDPTDQQATQKLVGEMKPFMSDAQARFANLQRLSQVLPYDTTSIIAEATAMHKDVSEVDKIRKRVYSEIKHDPNDKAIEKGGAVTNVQGEIKH